MRLVLFRSLWVLGLSGLLAMLAACVMKPPPVPGEAKDPGVRAGPPGAGEPLKGLDKHERTAFEVGKEEFAETEDPRDGLGPTMNLNSCVGCHVAPAMGGTSPAINPQVAFATELGAHNKVFSFLRADGPVREVRRVRNPDGSPDGGVHSLFSIAGRSDAPGCNLAQPDLEAELARHNIIFRIPTPIFGAGLIEMIPDREILANRGANRAEKAALGIVGKPNIVLPFHAISGQPNKNGNDGTLGRFGWKAQNKSLLVFAAEAYNVEMGVTSDAFPTEREEDPACQFARQPNNVRNFARSGKLDVEEVLEGAAAIEKFGFFMRFLAPPAPASGDPGGAASIERGRATFDKAGCALCHVPTMKTGDTFVNAMRNQPVHLFSDLLLHDMGEGLADGINQGQAGPRDFRTAPLWGLGQRHFFLHDGRTSDLREAILAHYSRHSEANEVVRRFYGFSNAEQQDLYNFLRSL
ncbi:MAG TPA: di-heme oxidoredictase family protein [Ideonella sp.]|jgi:CxxC motif-containing protein (DUF1111 family)|nr:di-heme oxidoredictase family protein [Ideonella sp.]